MDALKTHISISCDVYPELFAKLNAISNPHKRAELLKTLAEDGRRWRDGVYTVPPQAQPSEPLTSDTAPPGSNLDQDEEDFVLPAAALEDVKDIGW